MAGHSKFKNIQFRKGAQDKKRAKLFAKISKEITVAAKLGLPDPSANPRLRSAIALGRAQNMPKDNIERAVKKSYDENAENYEEVRYEGFGIEGVGIIVESLTDNRNRTAGDIRSIFSIALLLTLYVNPKVRVKITKSFFILPEILCKVKKAQIQNLLNLFH